MYYITKDLQTELSEIQEKARIFLRATKLIKQGKRCHRGNHIVYCRQVTVGRNRLEKYADYNYYQVLECAVCGQWLLADNMRSLPTIELSEQEAKILMER